MRALASISPSDRSASVSRTGHVPPRRQRPRLSAAAALLRRRRVTPPLPEGRTRARCWPTLLHRVSWHPLHCQTAPAQVACHPARPPLLRRGRPRPPRCRMAPAPAACHRPRPPLLRRRSSRPAPRRMAPMRALACRSRRAPLRRRSRHSACPLTAGRAARRPEQRRTQPAILSTAPTNPRHGATFLRLSGATSGNATQDAAVIAIRSPGAAAPLPICCRSTTCCRSPRAVARTRPISKFSVLPITACATATGRLRRRSARCSASSALLARRSTALADGSQVARPDTLRSAARRACIFATVSSDPGRSLVLRSCKALSRSHFNEFLPLPAFGPA